MNKSKDQMDQTHLGKKCDICGDIGVVDAIATCYQCKINCEHCYCMRTYHAYAPTDWLCEACESSNRSASPSGVNGDLPNAFISNSSTKVFYDTASGGPNKQINGSWKGKSPIHWEKKVEKGKVKFLPTQEAMMLSSGAKKWESSVNVKNNLRSRPESSRTMAPMTEKAPIKLITVSPKLSSHKVTANPRFGPPRHWRSLRPGNSHSNPMVQPQMMPSSKELKGKNAIVAPTMESTHKKPPVVALKPAEEIETTNTIVQNAVSKVLCESSPSMHCPPFTVPVVDLCPDMEPRTCDAEIGNLMLVPSKVEKLVPSDPVLDASWKGIFKLIDDLKLEELGNGIQCHTPHRVHRKVYECAKKMPEILQFELIPRINIWTVLFQDDSPVKDDIGLYFFPSDSERNESYISLMELMGSRDLVMRNIMNEVELLVFTSGILDVDSQSWNGKAFLWGLFHHVKKRSALGVDNIEFKFLGHPSMNGNNVEGDDSEVIDMDIDMLGGEYIGSVDVALSKKSLKCDSGSYREEPATPITLDSTVQQSLLDVERESCNDIPPGFENLCAVRSGLNRADSLSCRKTTYGC